MDKYNQLLKAITFYIGRTPYPREFGFINDNGEYKFIAWNVAEKLQPTIEQLEQIYADNIDSIEADEIREKRKVEFALFDKYQLYRVWNNLTPEQQTQYDNWRQQWLDAPTTFIEPDRLTWFEE